MSFLFELDPREEAGALLVAEVGKKLQRECLKRNLSQNDLAEKLDVNRSHVSRCLSGFNNLTLKTLAEFAWAMNSRVSFELVDAPLNATEEVVAALPSNVVAINFSVPTQAVAPHQEQSGDISMYKQKLG